MSLFSKPKYATIVAKKKDIPDGVWKKCPLSGEILFFKELEENLMVVPNSGFTFPSTLRPVSKRCSIKEVSSRWMILFGL